MLPQNKQGNHDALLLPHRGDCFSTELSSNNLCKQIMNVKQAVHFIIMKLLLSILSIGKKLYHLPHLLQWKKFSCPPVLCKKILKPITLSFDTGKAIKRKRHYSFKMYIITMRSNLYANSFFFFFLQMQIAKNMYKNKYSIALSFFQKIPKIRIKLSASSVFIIRDMKKK
jgi:hypothetical protein